MTKLELYTIARWCYKLGVNYIRDEEYNRVERELKEEFPNNEFIYSPWDNDICPVELLKREGLREYIKSVSSISHGGESMQELSSIDSIRAIFGNMQSRTRLGFKEDGLNTAVDYDNGKKVFAHTRGRSGNYKEANVVLELVPDEIPIMGDVKIYGELTIQLKRFEEYKMLTGSNTVRGCVSTALARGDHEYLHFSAFNIFSANVEIADRYDTLKQFGFDTPMNVVVDSYEKMEKAVSFLESRIKVYPFPTDGIVAENTSGQYALRVGEYAEVMLCSFVTGYKATQGIHGLHYVCEIFPVEIDGATQTCIDVTNIANIEDSDLKIGNPVAFSRRAKATPVLDRTGTMELQEKYDGKFDDYREMVKRGEVV